MDLKFKLDERVTAKGTGPQGRSRQLGSSHPRRQRVEIRQLFAFSRL